MQLPEAISYPWMVVLGGVFVEFSVIHPLMDYIWLGVHPSGDEQLLRVTRVLLALRRALQSLDRCYTQLNIPADPTAPTNLERFFPHVLSYPTANGDVRFEYVIKLADEGPAKAVFKAKIVEAEIILWSNLFRHTTSQPTTLLHNCLPRDN